MSQLSDFFSVTGGGAGLEWSNISTNTTATKNKGYFVDTSSGAITITLPATATTGDQVGISDYSGTFGSNKCIVARNSHNIMGDAEDFECDISNLGVLFVYSDVTIGWRIVNTADGVGAGGTGGGITWSAVSDDITGEGGNGYLFDNSILAHTLTLPASPTVGDTISAADLTGDFNIYPLTVARNGGKIMEMEEDMSLDVQYQRVTLVYSGETVGWSIIELEPSAVASTHSGRRNVIINGNFDIWQRGTSQVQTGYFSCDRWRFTDAAGDASMSVSRTSISQFDLTGYPASPVKYCMAVTTGNSFEPGHYFLSEQRIEDVRTLNGEEVTLSFWAKASSSSLKLSIDFYQYFGSAGAPSSSVSTCITTSGVSLTTGWAKYTVTVTVPSISGKTISTDGTDFLSLRFWFSAGSLWDDEAPALYLISPGQAGTFYIGQVQLEKGVNATDFEYRHPGEEIILCQRYYEASKATGLMNTYNVGYTKAQQQSFKVTKRAIPVVTLSNLWTLGQSGTLGPLYSNTITIQDFIPTYTISSGVAGQGYAHTYDWTADAEL